MMSFDIKLYQNPIIFVYLLVISIKCVCCRLILPHIPDIVHPSTPDGYPIPQSPFLTNSNINATTTNAAATGNSNPEYDPEETPGLFQGDIAINNLDHKHWKVGLSWDVFPERVWPNATVPYIISPLYEPGDQVTILQAIRTIDFMTCIKFIPWTGEQKDYLLIWPIKYPSGCWSYVGRIGGPQIVSLQPPNERGPNCLGTEGRAIHEIMHALGIFHEQSRADRDRFVKIHWDNIQERYKSNFEKQSMKNTTYQFEYDYQSIMHYGRGYFAKERGKPTITSRMGAAIKFGQRKALSKTDCLKINDLYKCLDDPRLERKYYAICRTLGV